MRICIVVAAAENGAIGKDNALLWRLPDDLRHFKALTMGKPLLMGRKTYDSIGRPLPGRRNIVITRQSGLQLTGCEVMTSLVAALQALGEAEDVMVIGGADLYRQVLPLAQAIYLTRVHAAPKGDVYFSYPEGEWRETHREEHGADDRHAHAFTFITLVRA